MADHILDTKGLNCPMPIMKTKKALKGMAAGQTLEVLSTDPGSVSDMESLCRTTGHKLMESAQDDGIYRFVIERV